MKARRHADIHQGRTAHAFGAAVVEPVGAAGGVQIAARVFGVKHTRGRNLEVALGGAIVHVGVEALAGFEYNDMQAGFAKFLGQNPTARPTANDHHIGHLAGARLKETRFLNEIAHDGAQFPRRPT